MLPNMFKGIFKGKGVPDMITFRVGLLEPEQKCMYCTTMTRDMLSANGIKFPSCGGASCNKAIIDRRLGRPANV